MPPVPLGHSGFTVPRTVSPSTSKTLEMWLEPRLVPHPKARLASRLITSYQTPQLYLEFPPSSGEPPQTLKGFTNVVLQPGEIQQAQITVSKYDLSYWDVVGQGWKKPSGTIGVRISQSSRIVTLQGSI